jgi:hypothetical protein
MADGAVVSNCSSQCFTSVYQPKHKDFCESCKAFKCKLHKTHEELKSAPIITDLIVREVNFVKASMGASTNRYQCNYDADFCSDESNGAGINNWIPVKNSHSDNNRHKTHGNQTI